MSDLLIKFASEIGITVDRLWPQMVMVTFVYNLIWLIIEPITLVISLLIIRWCWVSGRNKNRNNYDEPVLEIMLGVLILFLIALIISTFPTVVVDVLYPEAATVNHLLNK